MIKCILNTLKNNEIIDFLKFICSNTKIHNISNVLSFINAIFCVGFMYQYSKTKDPSLFLTMAFSILIPYLVIDLFITIYLIINKYDKKKCYEIVFHHILTLLLITWVYFIGRFRAPNVVYILILFETSTIFLNLRFWIKEYIKSFEATTNAIPTFIKILNPVVDVLFIVTFIYLRCYVFLKDIIFNKNFYNTLFVDGLFINKLFIVLIFVFLLLNFYWSFVIFKTLHKNLQKFVKDKYEYKDEELALIEKINLDIIKHRNQLV
jgi:hypothetical protein